MGNYEVNSRNKVKRVPQRGAYDKETAYEILDAGFLCHLGFIVDGQPFVIPTLYGRQGNTVFVHGASTSRMLTEIKKGVPVCLTVTHIDGLVLARSAFHHSMNYRSVVVFGNAVEVENPEKEKVLKIISDNIINNRWEETRTPSAKELKATTVLSIRINQASSKIRAGGPEDDEEDYDLNIWAGVVPIAPVFGTPVNDEKLKENIPLSQAVSELS